MDINRTNTAIRVLPLVLMLLVCCDFTHGQTYSNYQSLVSTVLTNYNPDIIPLNDHTQTLDVTISGTLYTLQEVDVVKGKVVVIFSLDVQWIDSQIQWTPSSYGNLDTIKIPISKVWDPPFVLATPLEFTTLGEDWMPVTYASNGTATLSLGDVLESSCTFNLRFWPFDKHSCDISFVSYGYASTKIRFLPPTNGETFNSHDIDNIEWEVTEKSWTITDTQGLYQINFQIKFQRRSGIFIIFILFPLYSLACLNGVVFLLPSDSGERVGYSVTMLLATTVFLEVISNYIPSTSNPLPLICLEVTLGISLSIMCTVIVIISWYYFDRSDEEPMHRFYVTFVKLFNKKYRKSSKVSNDDRSTKGAFDVEYPRPANGDVSRNSNYRNTSGIGTESKIVFGENYTKTFDDETKRRISVRPSTQVQEGDKNGRRSAVDSETSDNGTEITWKDVSYTIDKVTFVSSMMLHGVITFIFTLYLVLGSN